MAVKNESRGLVSGMRIILVQSTRYRAKGTALDQQSRLLVAQSNAPVPKGRHLLFGDDPATSFIRPHSAYPHE